jgi:hypothetical protein
MITESNHQERTPSEALQQFLDYHNLTFEELLALEDNYIYAMVGCTVQLLLEIKEFRQG